MFVDAIIYLLKLMVIFSHSIHSVAHLRRNNVQFVSQFSEAHPL